MKTSSVFSDAPDDSVFVFTLLKPVQLQKPDLFTDALWVSGRAADPAVTSVIKCGTDSEALERVHSGGCTAHSHNPTVDIVRAERINLC